MRLEITLGNKFLESEENPFGISTIDDNDIETLLQILHKKLYSGNGVFPLRLSNGEVLLFSKGHLDVGTVKAVK